MSLISVGAYLLVLFATFLNFPIIIKTLNIQISKPGKVSFFITSIINASYKVQSLFMPEQYSGKITKIHIHPLKSVGFISVNEWEVGEYGLKYDRQYMIGYWNEKRQMYSPVTIRNVAKFALVKPSANLAENYFEYRYPDSEGNERSFRLPCEVSDDFIKKNSIELHDTKTEVFGVKMESYNIGKAIPSEFYKSMNLEGRYKDVTLLYNKVPKHLVTYLPNEIKEERGTVFQDYYPIHSIDQKELDDLNSRLKQDGFDRTLKPEQFRPNLVVDDIPKSILMDEWFDLSLKSKDPITSEVKVHRIKTGGRCLRCTVPNNNIDNGTYDKSNKVTKKLTEYRKIDPASPYGYFFGHNLIQCEFGYKIHVGDEFYVRQKRINLHEDTT